MIKIDLKKDFEQILKSRYENEKIKFDESKSINLIFEDFLSYKRRSYFQASYILKETNEVKEKLKELSEKYINYYKQILYAFSSGGNISHFLSKQITNLESQDRMLIDDGIYHFHLGEITKERFSKRGDYLLFVFIENNVAYFLDIRSHGEKDLFYKNDLLKILDRNFPKLLEKYQLCSLKSTNVSLEIRKEAKKNRKVLISNINGKMIFPIFGLINSKGTSVTDMEKSKFMMSILEQLEYELKKCTNLSKGFYAYKLLKIEGSKYYFQKDKNSIFESFVICDTKDNYIKIEEMRLK